MKLIEYSWRRVREDWARTVFTCSRKGRFRSMYAIVVQITSAFLSRAYARLRNAVVICWFRPLYGCVLCASLLWCVEEDVTHLSMVRLTFLFINFTCVVCDI